MNRPDDRDNSDKEQQSEMRRHQHRRLEDKMDDVEDDDEEEEEDDDDELDDRKPPARVVTVPRNNSRSNVCSNSSQEEEEEEEEEGESSLASTLRSSAAPMSQPPAVAASASSFVSSQMTPIMEHPEAIVNSGSTSKSKLQTQKSLLSAQDTAWASAALSAFNISSSDYPTNFPVDLIVVYSSSLAVSFGAFMSIVFPWTALLALLVFASSFGMILYSLYGYVYAELQRRIETNGLLGDSAPRSLLRMLTELSIHEFMTDRSAAMENQHLMLYFLPVSPERLETLVDRLAPRHRDNLRRRGFLGHYLGPTLTRILIGDERYQQMISSNNNNTSSNNNNNNNVTIQLLHDNTGSGYPPSSAVATSNGDDISELELDHDHQQQVPRGVSRNRGIATHVDWVAARDVALTPQQQTSRVVAIPSTSATTNVNNINSDTTGMNENELQLELRVISDAIVAAFYDSVWSPLSAFALSMSTTLVRSSANLIRDAVPTTVILTGGIGLARYWWVTRSFTSSSMRSTGTPSSSLAGSIASTFTSTTVLGAASVGVMVALYRSNRRGRINNNNNGSDSKAAQNKAANKKD